MRLFCAIDSDPALHPVFARAIDQCRPFGADARWTTPAQWHVTVKFLGEVGELAIPEIHEVLLRAAAASRPVPLKLGGIGVFGGLNPRVIFAKVADPTGFLDRLAADINVAARPLGFHPDNHAFNPHVTLARARSRPDGPALLGAIRKESPAVKGEWEAREVVLYQSILKPTGAEYAVLLRAPLGPAGDGRRTRGRSDSR